MANNKITGKIAIQKGIKRDRLVPPISRMKAYEICNNKDINSKDKNDKIYKYKKSIDEAPLIDTFPLKKKSIGLYEYIFTEIFKL